MVYCQDCGTENLEIANFCQECGEKIVELKEPYFKIKENFSNNSLKSAEISEMKPETKNVTKPHESLELNNKLKKIPNPQGVPQAPDYADCEQVKIHLDEIKYYGNRSSNLILFFTEKRIIVASNRINNKKILEQIISETKLSKGAKTSVLAGATAGAVLLGPGIVTAALGASIGGSAVAGYIQGKKNKDHLKTFPPYKILIANKNNFEIPYSEIEGFEMKRGSTFRLHRLKIFTKNKRHKFKFTSPQFPSSKEFKRIQRRVEYILSNIKKSD